MSSSENFVDNKILCKSVRFDDTKLSKGGRKIDASLYTRTFKSESDKFRGC